MSSSSCDMFFRAPLMWGVIKFGFLQGCWLSFHCILSLDYVIHLWGLNYHLKTTLNMYLLLRSESLSQHTQSGTTWPPLLHSKTIPLFSSLPSLVLGHHHYLKSGKLWATWSFLCSLTVSARRSLMLHLKSVFSMSSPVLVSVQVLFLSNLSYNNRLLFDLPDFRLTPTFFPPYCYWSDLLNFKSDQVISQMSSLSDFQKLRRQDWSSAKSFLIWSQPTSPASFPAAAYFLTSAFSPPSPFYHPVSPLLHFPFFFFPFSASFFSIKLFLVLWRGQGSFIGLNHQRRDTLPTLDSTDLLFRPTRASSNTIPSSFSKLSSRLFPCSTFVPCL